MPTPIQGLLAQPAQRAYSGSSSAIADGSREAQQPFAKWLSAQSKTPSTSNSEADGNAEAQPSGRGVDNGDPQRRGNEKVALNRTTPRRKTDKPKDKADSADASKTEKTNDETPDPAEESVVSKDEAAVSDASPANKPVKNDGKPSDVEQPPVDATSTDAKVAAATPAAGVLDPEIAVTPVDEKSRDEEAPEKSAPDADASLDASLLALAQAGAATNTVAAKPAPNADEPKPAEPSGADINAVVTAARPDARHPATPPEPADAPGPQKVAGNTDPAQQQGTAIPQEMTPVVDGAQDAAVEKPAAKTAGTSDVSSFENVLAKMDPQHKPQVSDVAQPTPATNDARIAAQNHENIVQNVQAKLLPDGGTMSIRLDPPELGDLQVTITMRDGALNASFKTSNDDATRMLSHSLADLKSTLEAAGVVVDKIHVQQTPKDEQARNDSRNGQGGGQQDAVDDQSSARQEQQRKEMVRRLWRRLSLGRDELDMVA